MDAHIILQFNGTGLLFNNSDIIESNFSVLNYSLPALEFQDSVPYYGEYFKAYSEKYDVVHKYLSCIVCVFGIMVNVLNIIVLTRKNMVSSINVILTGLAVSDMLLMFAYLPHVYLNFIGDNNDEKRYSYGRAILFLLLGHFSVLSHITSIWLTLTVAIWRFIGISFPLKSACWCSLERAKVATTIIYVSCTVFCIPTYMSSTLCKNKDEEFFYHVCLSGIYNRHGQLLRKTNFWLYSIFTKIVPCVALIVLSLGLIHVLKKADKLRKIMKNRSESDTSHDKTTKIVLAVVSIFLLTQFPVGILVLLTTILGKEFLHNVYYNLGETVDALNLINSAANFIVYCSINKKFRDTFSILFLPKCMKKQEVAPIEKSSETVSTICELDGKFMYIYKL